MSYPKIISGDEIYNIAQPLGAESGRTLALYCLEGMVEVVGTTERQCLESCQALLVDSLTTQQLSPRQARAVLAKMPAPSLALATLPASPIVIPPLEAAVLQEVCADRHCSLAHQETAVAFVAHQLWGGESDVRATSDIVESLSEAVNGFLQQHLDTPLRIDELAAQHNLSRSHLLRTYKTATGTSPMQHLAELRIARSKELLEQTDLPISQVAHAVGYAALAAFSHFFKRHTGVSPAEYRSNCRWLV